MIAFKVSDLLPKTFNQSVFKKVPLVQGTNPTNGILQIQLLQVTKSPYLHRTSITINNLQVRHMHLQFWPNWK